MKYISENEIESLRPKNKYKWVHWPLMLQESLNWTKQPYIFQCLKCHSHFTHNDCTNCGNNTFISGNNATGIFCESCELGVTSWICKNCNTKNPVSKTRYILRKQGCFIATAVYGSPFAKEVIILQKFRDNYLEKYSIGRLFVKLYYWISPSLSKMILKSDILKTTVKIIFIKPLLMLFNNLKNKEK